MNIKKELDVIKTEYNNKIAKSDEEITIFRFMGIGELQGLLKGEILINPKKSHKHKRTNSEGFCFMEGDKSDWEWAYQFLSGIVDENSILVIFKTKKHNLVKGFGAYKSFNPFKLDNYPDYITEYSAISYNKEDFEILEIHKKFRNLREEREMYGDEY